MGSLIFWAQWPHFARSHLIIGITIAVSCSYKDCKGSVQDLGICAHKDSQWRQVHLSSVSEILVILLSSNQLILWWIHRTCSLILGQNSASGPRIFLPGNLKLLICWPFMQVITIFLLLVACVCIETHELCLSYPIWYFLLFCVGPGHGAQNFELIV